MLIKLINSTRPRCGSPTMPNSFIPWSRSSEIPMTIQRVFLRVHLYWLEFSTIHCMADKDVVNPVVASEEQF